jgi:mycobactin peptide synthetase MbtE
VIALTEIRAELIDTEYEPPEGMLETTVARIQAEVIGIDQVGRSDSFYDFGGTSLQAIRICSRIERETGRQAQPAWLFDTDILSEFVERLQSAEAPDQVGPGETRDGAAEFVRLSEGQVALWLDGLVRPERALGNVVVSGHRLSPAPPRATLLAALRAFSTRHEALVTAIQADGDGLPKAVALSPSDAFVIDDRAVTDGSLQSRAESVAQRVDIELGPLMVARVDPAPDGCDLLVAFHHACFDGHSEALFSAELSALLRGETLAAAPPLAGLPMVAARPDAAWRENWGARLAATQDVTWPQAGLHDQPAGQAQSGAIRFDVPSVAAWLAERARMAGLAPFVLVLQAVARAIRDASGTASFCLGVPTSVRDIGSDDAIGNFVRQTVVPLGPEEFDAPIAVLAETWEQARMATGMGVSELARLAGRGANRRSRLFQVQFAWQNQPGTAWGIPGTVVSELPIRPMAPQFDLTVELRPTSAGSVAGLVEYDTKVVPGPVAADVVEELLAWFAEGAIAAT